MQEIRFLRCIATGRAMFHDDLIALYPRDLYKKNRELGTVLTFDIVEIIGDQLAGEISLRMGDSPAQFYLGHIGYHIDPPFRGKHEALRACRLVIPLMREYGHRSFVITTDTDNLPSIRTCEKLGCILESTVPVPDAVRKSYQLSRKKRRYIYTCL